MPVDDPADELPAAAEAMRVLQRLAGGAAQHGRAPARAAAAPSGASAEERTALRYRNLVEQIPAVVFTASLDGGMYDLYVSPQIEQLLGYSQAEWIGDPMLWYERLHPEDRRTLDEEFARGCREGGPFRADCRFLDRQGRVVWVHGEARLIADVTGVPVLLQGVGFDISEIKRAEEVVRESLREKETLLKEIHHRVKNNMQVTSSLLNLQAKQTTNAEARRALEEGRNRVHAMALVHELLYRSDDLSRVDMSQYIRDLVQQLTRSFGADARRVRLDIRADDTTLGVERAVPCGIVLNELVSNALKHAFADREQGVLEVVFRAEGDGHELIVRDDGAGLPQGIDVTTGASLGLRLVHMLAEQVDGHVDARSGSWGTEFRLIMPRSPKRQP